jgi:hypothetical protein
VECLLQYFGSGKAALDQMQVCRRLKMVELLIHGQDAGLVEGSIGGSCQGKQAPDQMPADEAVCAGDDYVHG